MKIYTKVVIDIGTGRIKSAEFEEYSGPVAQCKGGGSTTTNTQDPVYNAGMLAISEEQQEMAATLFNQYMYGVDYDPTSSGEGLTIDGQWYSKEQLAGDSALADQYLKINPAYEAYMEKAERMGLKGMSPEKIEKKLGGPAPEKYLSEGLETKSLGEAYGYDDAAITSEAEYYQNVINSNQQLLGAQTEAELANLGLTLEQIEAKRTILPLYTEAVMEPIDTDRKMSEAQAGVQHAYDLQGKEFERKMFTSGVNPGDPGYATAINSRNLSLSKDIAAARTQAKQDAEDTKFNRLQSAMTTGF